MIPAGTLNQALTGGNKVKKLNKMEKKKKILIIRNDHIGDMVLSMQVFKGIKKEIPNSEITLIASGLNKIIAEKDKNIDKIIELEIPNLSMKTIFRYLKMAFKIRKEKFDIGVDLRGSLMNSFFLLWLPGIKKRIARIDSHPEISFLLSNPINLNKKNNLIIQNVEIINKGLNLNVKDYWPKVVNDEEDKKQVEEFIKHNKLGKYICISPLVDLKYKQWELNNFKKLLKWLEGYNFNVLLLGQKKNEEILNDLKSYNKRAIIVMDFNLRKMSSLFKKSVLVIAQDGGPLQISWVSKAKTIALLPNFIDAPHSLDPIGENSIIIKSVKEVSVVKNSEGTDKNLNLDLEEVKKGIKKFIDKY